MNNPEDFKLLLQILLLLVTLLTESPLVLLGAIALLLLYLFTKKDD